MCYQLIQESINKPQPSPTLTVSQKQLQLGPLLFSHPELEAVHGKHAPSLPGSSVELRHHMAHCSEAAVMRQCALDFCLG